MTASSLTDTQGIIAIAAIALAGCAVVCCAALARGFRRLRSNQRMVLGEHSERDVVAHGAALQEAFEELQEYVGEVASRLEGRLQNAENALAGAVTRRALVRYDAYNELSGQQSVSIALLDERGTGVVLSCIHHRDQARVYAKQVIAGRGELQLSPEEEEAVREAMGSDGKAGAPRAAASMSGPNELSG